MERRKRIISIFMVITLALFAFVGCGANEANDGDDATESKVIKVGASPVPHAEVLNVAKGILAEEGITLEIVEFQDYVQPNLVLDDGELDANYFQHLPYLDSFSDEHDLDLVSVAGVHIEPMGIYSKNITSLDELKEADKIAIPNDPTNGGRALLLLQTAGLIKLDPESGLAATEKDIVENPNNIEIEPLEAAMLPRVLDDVALAVINTNYALDAGLSPIDDAIVIEGSDSPYVNILVTRKDNQDDENIQKLIQVLNSDDIKTFIETEYKGAVIPAF